MVPFADGGIAQGRAVPSTSRCCQPAAGGIQHSALEEKGWAGVQGMQVGPKRRGEPYRWQIHKCTGLWCLCSRLLPLMVIGKSFKRIISNKH